MRILLYVLGCAAAASALSLILQYAVGPRPLFELAATGLFFLGVVACIYRDGTDPFASPKHVVLAPFAFTIASTGLALAGMLILSRWPTLGVILISPMGLGYYPSGPDVPFFYGATAWVISMIILIAGAIATGAFLRHLRTRHHPRPDPD